MCALPKLFAEIMSRFERFEGFERMHIETYFDFEEKIISCRLIVESIVQNIIENAIKYQNKNNSQSFLKIRVLKGVNEVLFRFEDNGIGIPKKASQKIFDMYYRGSEISKGSGLGLYLVKNGVSRLGGKILVESEEGKGALFEILIPVSF